MTNEKIIEKYDKNDFLNFLYPQENRVIGFKACNKDEKCDCKLTNKFKKKFNKPIKNFIFNTLAEQKKEIIKLIDDIELENRDSSFAEWKEYKHIRNSIRENFGEIKK